MTDLKVYSVWDASVRWFHWINLLCVLGLSAVSMVILNAKVLGVPSDGKNTSLPPVFYAVTICNNFNPDGNNCETACSHNVQHGLSVWGLLFLHNVKPSFEPT